MVCQCSADESEVGQRFGGKELEDHSHREYVLLSHDPEEQIETQNHEKGPVKCEVEEDVATRPPHDRRRFRLSKEINETKHNNSLFIIIRE